MSSTPDMQQMALWPRYICRCDLQRRPYVLHPHLTTLGVHYRVYRRHRTCNEWLYASATSFFCLHVTAYGQVRLELCVAVRIAVCCSVCCSMCCSVCCSMCCSVCCSVFCTVRRVSSARTRRSMGRLLFSAELFWYVEAGRSHFSVLQCVAVCCSVLQ